MAPNTITHWINNKPYPGAGGATAPVTNPATGAVTGEVMLASVEDARAVIDAATAAFPGWRDTSLAKRGAILFNFRELLNARKPELAAIITSEHGKVVSTHSARSAAVRGRRIACGCHICSRAGSPRTPQPRSMSTRSASTSGLGIISPFSFPPWCRCGFHIAIAGGQHRCACRPRRTRQRHCG
jgi:malonate-semialdehyde dehydrogenase (acetylating)/methylmalonate-semialdehyde dehydrogenase